MSESVSLVQAIAKVESDIVELRIRLSKHKDALISVGKKAVWNAERAALTKPLYNLLERRWALSLLKHAPSSKALYNVKVVGILLPEMMEGAIVPPAKRLIVTDVMTKNGPMPLRTYDVLQFEMDNPNVQPHELKSDAGKTKKGVLATSVKGGLTHPDIEVHLREKSSPAKQIAREKQLISEALKVPGAKIVVEGTDAVSGNVISKNLDPHGLNLSRFHNYTDLPDVLTLGKPDPADLAPVSSEKRTKQTKAKPTKGRSPKKQRVKRKANPRLTTNRGVTPPSPNAPTELADADVSAKQKVKPSAKVKTPPALERGLTPRTPHTSVTDLPDPNKAADETLIAKSKPTLPTRTPAGVQQTAPITTGTVLDEPASAAPSPSRVGSHPVPAKGKFSLRLKLTPKIKAIGSFVLTIGFDLFVGWLEGRRISKMIKALLEENTERFTDVINAVATQEDFVRFRIGNNLEKGYQLYFEIKLTVTRHCSDGGCGFSGTISDISFKEVNFSRKHGSDFFPDPQTEKGWAGPRGEATATFYQAIFQEGIPVRTASEDAATDDLEEFDQSFVSRTKRVITDYTREYFDDFSQYCQFFPGSKAGHFFMDFEWDDYLRDITAVELARKSPTIMMATPHTLQFDEVLNQVRWGLASRMSFIVEFYKLVIQMRPDLQIYYLDRFEKYFKEMDDGYRKCDFNCHRTTGDKRIIHRLNSDDVRQKLPFLRFGAKE
jgi:hypothetical protein